MNQRRGVVPEPEALTGHRNGEIEIVSCRLRNGIVLGVSGEVDLATAPAVEHELLRAEESHDLVALDLTQTSFMDSTGLHMIIAAQRRLRERGGRLLVVQGPPQIRQLFELTGVADQVELVDDAAELQRATEPAGDPAGPGFSAELARVPPAQEPSRRHDSIDRPTQSGPPPSTLSLSPAAGHLARTPRQPSEATHGTALGRGAMEPIAEREQRR